MIQQAAARNEPYDIVFIDWQMPGVEWCKITISLIERLSATWPNSRHLGQVGISCGLHGCAAQADIALQLPLLVRH
jgi:hypothetical protein